MKPDRIEFARIDARDDGYTGYSTVAFVANNQRIERLGKENSRLTYLMEREYLTRLQALQEEIRKKYLQLAQDEPVPEESSEDYDGCLTKEEYDAIEAEANSFYPAKAELEDLYYT